MKKSRRRRSVVRILFLAVLLCVILGGGASAQWKTNSKGKRYIGKNKEYVTGWKRIGGKWYHFGKDRYMDKGWLTVNGKKYYLDQKTGVRTTGWRRIGSYKYYFDKNGVMQKNGWKKIGGKYYYLQASGRLAVNTWVGRYQVGKSGARTGKIRKTGVVCEKGKYYYYNSKYRKQSGWVTYRGSRYYFGKDYAAVTGMRKLGSNTYYFDKKGVMQKNGWLKRNGRRYYFKSNGTMAKNTTMTIKGKTYTFNANGYAADQNKGRQIAQYARKFKGNPYVYGGTSLTNGADCSGFTQSVMKKFGIKIPRVAEDQRKGTDPWGTYTKSVTVKANKASLLPGDLVFYGKPAYHVALYIGSGKVIHASTPQTGIIISNYNYAAPSGARRYWQ